MGQQVSLLLDAASRGDNGKVQHILQRTAANVNAHDEDDWTALHFAASQNHEAVVKTLLSFGGNIEQVESNGETALHLAAFNGSKAVVSLLLDKGASVDPPDVNAQTPLHKASAGGHVPIIDLLLGKHADIQAVDQTGQTPADLAEAEGHHSVARLLRQQPSTIVPSAPPLPASPTTHLNAQAAADVVRQGSAPAPALLPNRPASRASDADSTAHTSTAAQLPAIWYPTLSAAHAEGAGRSTGHGSDAEISATAAAALGERVLRPGSRIGQAVAAAGSMLQDWVPSALYSRTPQAAIPFISHPLADESPRQQQHQQQQVFSGPYGLQDSESDAEDTSGAAASASAPQADEVLQHLAGLQLQDSLQTEAPQPQADLPRWTEFSFAELAACCGGFSQGTLLNPNAPQADQMYQGLLQGEHVAVRLVQPHCIQSLGGIQIRQWLNDAACWQHPNLVPVLGACLEQEAAVVYRLTQCCSLEDVLNGFTQHQLPFHARVSIAVACCQGIIYLHEQGVALSGLRPSVVFLPGIHQPQLVCDEKMHVCIGSGDIYHPNSLPRRQERNIHSLGVLMLQLLTARQARSSWQEEGLIRDVASNLPIGLQSVDPACTQCWPEHANQLVQIALRCTQPVKPSLVQAILPQLQALSAASQGMLAQGGCGYAQAASASQRVIEQQAPGSAQAAAATSSAQQGAVDTPDTQQPAQDEAPQLYLCPISQDIMEDPVLADDGWTYDRRYIQRWLDMGRRRSPITNDTLASKNLIPNRSIKSEIAEWKQKHRL